MGTTNQEAIRILNEQRNKFMDEQVDFGGVNEAYNMAITLLKEQEVKCLTKAELDDLNENQFVWIEGRTGYLYCLQIIGICRGKTGVSDIQFNAPTSYVERYTNRYGKSYRIWTNKPTEKQRQAVKWE